VPLSIIAKKIGAKPFMEYALSYALYNYAKVNKSDALEYDNLKLIRLFDGSPAEHGFILVHVDMVRFSGLLVTNVAQAMRCAESKDRYNFNQAMISLYDAQTKINEKMETMWRNSKPDGYQGLRTFIMGTFNQPMFPNGVLYEGVSDARTQYRGESGANDSIIPTLDNFLQVTENLPSNPLTDVLRDFRTYRPPHHNEWLSFVEDNAKKVNIRGFSLQNAESALLYIKNLDKIREFRLRHWNFTKEYIMKYSKHPVATGGSPITTWLPNQLSAVMGILVDSCAKVNPNQFTTDESKKKFHLLKTQAIEQKKTLDSEVDQLRKEYGQ
jgi:indoleamine 2,3-dioxygenase